MKAIRFYIVSFFLLTSLFTFSFADEVDVDTPIVTISPEFLTVTETEGTQTVDVTISLDHCPTNSDIHLNYSTSTGTAFGADYVTTSGSITFPVGGGTCSQTISVEILGDTFAESTEYFWLNFSRGAFPTTQGIKWPGTNQTSGKSKITIVDNDDYDEPILTITPSSQHVTEGDSGTTSVPVSFRLDHCPTVQDIKLKYFNYQDSAKYLNNDYVRMTTQYITFHVGDPEPCESGPINMVIKGDTTFENDERFWFYVQRYGATNPNQRMAYAATNSNERVAIWIDNDDQQADLRMYKSINGGSTTSHAIGDIVTFRLRAKNFGPSPSTMKITDALPAGLEFVSVTDDSANFSCSETANIITCDGARIFNSGEQVKVVLKARTTIAGIIGNTASVSSDNGVYDNRLSNNIASINVAVEVPGGTNTVRISKTVDNTTPEVGDNVTFTVTVTNKGFDKRIAMRDKFPLGGDDWGTTGGAFELVSYTKPADVTCEELTHNGNPYLFCYSDGNYTHNESFTVNIVAKIKKAGHLCNRARGYEYPSSWIRSSTVCVDSISVTPPTLAPLSDQIAYVGSFFWYDIRPFATDAENDPLVFSATGLPPGLTMRSDGVVVGTPDVSSAGNTYPVTVTVADQPLSGAAPQSVSQTFNIEVRYPDVIALDDSYNIENNQMLTGNILTNDSGYLITVVSHTPVAATDGNLTLNPDGSFVFQPTFSFLGQTSFTYTIRDAQGTERNATVTINFSTDYEDGFQPFVLINPPGVRNVLGNFAIAGNTVECITDSTTDFNGTCTDDQTVISNNFVTKYIDMDEDPSTWNSSSSYFETPSRFDTNKGVLWAGLFWQGRFTTDAVSPTGASADRLIRYGTPSGLVTSINTNSIDFFNANKIKLKINNGSSYDPAAIYTDILAQTLYSNRNGGGVSYAAFANVTELLHNSVGSAGSFTATVANLPTAEGYEQNPGLYGGWSLVVIYAEDFTGKVRNISVYNGYDQIDNNDPQNQVTEITISGFKLPAQNAINASLAMFSGEGEYPLGNSNNDYDRVLLSQDGVTYTYTDGTTGLASPYNKALDNTFDAKLTGVNRATIPGHANALLNNNTGLDLDFYPISDVMTAYRDIDENITSVHIKWETNLDSVNPSMMVFAAELYVPKLCYDYSYKQNGITFSEDNNGTQTPRIVGSNLSPDDITLELYIKNEEASDATLQNVRLDVYDFNTTQVHYQSDTTYVTYPGTYFPRHILDTDMNTSNSHVNDIPLLAIGAQDGVYVDLDLALQNDISSIDMPLNGKVNFTLDLLGGISYDLIIPFEDMTICGNGRYNYVPPYDVFNVEDKALSVNAANVPLSSRYYDLPTQIVKRVGDYTISAYEDTNIHQPKQVKTLVAVELVDVGKYHDVNASCFEPDNTLSPRIWIPFDQNVTNRDFTENAIQNAINNGRVSNAILSGLPSFSDPANFYDKARKNVAFRVSYVLAADEGNTFGLEEVPCAIEDSPCYKVNNHALLNTFDIGNGAGNCVKPMRNGTTTIAANCDNNAHELNRRQLATCLECAYGTNIRYVCSRDNFAIRPEAFRVSLSDKDQNATGTRPPNLITKNDAAATSPNLVAGYKYLVEINATDFTSDNATPGYFGHFEESGAEGNRSFGFVWDTNPGINPNTCLVKEDANGSANFYNGAATTEASADELGKYSLSALDKIYTITDWGTSQTAHQIGTHFLSGVDCLQGSATTQPESTATTISLQDLATVNGCNISSNSGANYTDIATQFYPYTFNLGGLTPQAGPNERSIIYIDNPDTVAAFNSDMSYNVNGTYWAGAYATNTNASSKLKNFTAGCWAANTVMELNITHLAPTVAPTNTPNLSYSLRDVDDIVAPTNYYRPTDGTLEVNTLTTTYGAPDIISIPQNIADYNIAMEGAITMDLGYNFARTNDLPLNPRRIQFNDFQVKYTTNPTNLYADGNTNYTIQGAVEPIVAPNRDVTFVYGRAKPSKTLYDDVTANSIATPISIVVYCDLPTAECQNRGLPTNNTQTGLADWWLNLAHNTTQSDGNIVLQVTSGAASVAPTNPSITANATNSAVTVTKTGTPALPMTTNIDLLTGLGSTDRWLIYNPLDPLAVPTPFYKVRFIGASQWAGHGDTGHVVGGTLNKKKNQRLGW